MWTWPLFLLLLPHGPVERVVTIPANDANWCACRYAGGDSTAFYTSGRNRKPYTIRLNVPERHRDTVFSVECGPGAKR